MVAEGGKRTINQLAMRNGRNLESMGENRKGGSPDSIPITLLDDYHSIKQRMEGRRQREEENGGVVMEELKES